MIKHYTESDAIEEFRGKMVDEGFSPGTIIPDGQIHRFSTSDKNIHDRAGYYSLHIDPTQGTFFGFFGDWRTGQKGTWTSTKVDELLTKTMSYIQSKIKEQQLEAEKDRKNEQKKAAIEAKKILTQASQASPENQYLRSKAISTEEVLVGLKQNGADLLIPVLDINGSPMSLLRVKPTGQKYFLKGGRTKGGYFIVNHKAPLSPTNKYIAEGIATALSIAMALGEQVYCAFSASNLPVITDFIKQQSPSATIIICADNDHESTINTGIKYAKEAVNQVNGLLIHPPDQNNISDYNDFHVAHGITKLKEILETKIKAEIARVEIEKCKLLDNIEYEQCREETAKKLGIRVSSLDQAVTESPHIPQDNLFFDPIIPYRSNVDGLKLFRQITKVLEDYSVLPTGAATAITLWIFLTYCYDHWITLPILLITSPDKRCGKSTLLTSLDCLCFNAISASNISSAAFYRLVDIASPCLLVDEGDTFLASNEALRGVINSGHTKTQAFVIRCNGEENRPEKYSTWCPKALAMIGTPADTIYDRSIPIPLTRKLPKEARKRYTADSMNEISKLRSKLLKFTQDSHKILSSTRPKRLQSTNDRTADNWEPLLAIAQVIGIEEDAIAAANSLYADNEDELPQSALLLNDIKLIFQTKTIDRIYSVDLVQYLLEMTDRPWGEIRYGRGLNQYTLAQMLKPFKVVPKSIRIPGDPSPKRGYLAKAFQDAWERYT